MDSMAQISSLVTSVYAGGLIVVRLFIERALSILSDTTMDLVTSAL